MCKAAPTECNLILRRRVLGWEELEEELVRIAHSRADGEGGQRRIPVEWVSGRAFLSKVNPKQNLAKDIYVRHSRHTMKEYSRHCLKICLKGLSRLDSLFKNEPTSASEELLWIY